MLPHSQQHGCGQWLTVHFTALENGHDVTTEAVEAAATQLHDDRAEALAGERDRIRRELLGELREALERLAEPLWEDETMEDRRLEVHNGSETDPGVYLDGEQWCAWAYDPESEEPLNVSEADLESEQR